MRATTLKFRILKTASFIVPLFAVLSSADAQFLTSFEDLWDVSQGTVVTSSSGVLAGSNARDMFGASSGGVESGNTLFADFRSQGFTHFVEWQTPEPITLRSFVLFAAHDGGIPSFVFRGFTEFRLKAFNDSTSAFDILLATFNPSSPYDPPTGALLTLGMNVPPTTTSRFRAEFDQAATPSNRAGPRILELDGYSTVIPEPTTLAMTLLGLGMLAAASVRSRIRRDRNRRN